MRNKHQLLKASLEDQPPSAFAAPENIYVPAAGPAAIVDNSKLADVLASICP